jgi:lauroyl/myristoyl acyltransferase
MIRQPDGKFIGWFGTPVYVDPNAPQEDGLRQATQAIAGQLEQRIRAFPLLWYQFYPYWGTDQSDAAGLGHVTCPPHD